MAGADDRMTPATPGDPEEAKPVPATEWWEVLCTGVMILVALAAMAVGVTSAFEVIAEVAKFSVRTR